MKKFGIAITCLVILGGAGGYYLYSNLDALVKRAIEAAGTAAVGTPVRVDSVEIDLVGGRAAIHGFSVANPEGYSANAMLTFGELSVVLDRSRLSSSEVGIVSITAHNPRVLYETRDELSNFDIVMARFPGAAPANQPEQVNDMQLAIGTLVVAEIQAGLQSPLLPQPVFVNLGSIELRDLAGTPAELGSQILRPLLSQLSRNAGAAMVRASAAQLRDTAQALGQQTLQQAGRQLDNAGEVVGTTGTRLREGLGNLLNRNDDEEDTR